MPETTCNDFERRFTETRVGLTDAKKIRGTAIVFNSRSVNFGGFTEIINPDAIDRTLREALDVRALVDHDSGKVMGRTRAGTLSLRKSRTGLEVEIDPPNTSFANDTLESVQRGDITGMSFGFRVLTDDWHMEDGELVREVIDMVVSEVSIVAFPAYQATDVTVAKRSLAAYQAECRPTHTWDAINRRIRLAR